MTEFLTSETGLWMLFVSGFLSATLLPGSSEATLIAVIKLGGHPPVDGDFRGHPWQYARRANELWTGPFASG